jgi:hypothetical protein
MRTLPSAMLTMRIVSAATLYSSVLSSVRSARASAQSPSQPGTGRRPMRNWSNAGNPAVSRSTACTLR